MQIQLTYWQPFSLFNSLCSSVETWLLTLAWWSCGLTVQWLNGPCYWWRNKWGKEETILPKNNLKKVPICVMVCVCTVICMCMQARTRGVAGQWGAGSLSAAGGSTGLVEAHGFAQPAGKVHFLHFWALDECVILKRTNGRPTFEALTSLTLENKTNDWC